MEQKDIQPSEMRAYRTFSRLDNIFYLDQHYWMSRRLKEFPLDSHFRNYNCPFPYSKWNDIELYLNVAFMCYGGILVDYECCLFKTDKEYFFLPFTTINRPERVTMFPQEFRIQSCRFVNKEDETRKKDKFLFTSTQGSEKYVFSTRNDSKP